MILNLVLFLIGFPLLAALILVLFKNAPIRTTLLKIFAVIIIIASIVLAVLTINIDSQYFSFELPHLEWIFLGVEMIMIFYLLFKSIQHKKIGTFIIALIQIGLTVFFQVFYGNSIKVENSLFIDKLTIIMVLIIGVIGSLICFYAIGYMKDYHKHHKEMPDNRRFFAFFLFAFLSAMFGIVFSNNLLWLNFFWEVTTFCSFILIGYSKTTEATNNAFRAVFLNLIGGIVFTAGIIYLYANLNIIEMDKLLVAIKGQSGQVATIAAICLCFAGIVKSAQFPFSTWLLGAMVAPTPVSALLHSSTMVKAGVYLVVRVAPLLAGTASGNSIALIGGITFLFGSLIAISQRNAKRVLAYSTVANLGLIIACAGIGNNETITAAILLIIFHAVAKSLLFLSVGTVEHKIGSRDIESMDWLIVRLPKIAIAMVIGIAGMFLPPFGMLISKWIVLSAFVDSHSILSPFLILSLAFGSAFNLFFWTKWLGKIISMMKNQHEAKHKIYFEETFIIWILAIITIITCLVLPFISKYFIEPYIKAPYLSEAFGTNFIILAVMVLILLILPVSLFFFGRSSKKVQPYLSGRNSTDSLTFEGTFYKMKHITMKNYYFEDIIKESLFLKIGGIIAFILIITIFLGSII